MHLLAQRLHTGLADGHLLSQIRLEVAQSAAQLRREIVSLEVLHDKLNRPKGRDSAKQRCSEVKQYAQVELGVWNLVPVKDAQESGQPQARKMGIFELRIVLVEPRKTLKHGSYLIHKLALGQLPPYSHIERNECRVSLLFGEQVIVQTHMRGVQGIVWRQQKTVRARNRRFHAGGSIG